MGMGIARLVSREWEWEWEGIKTLHFPICHPQVADHQTLLIDLCFCIVIYCRLLGYVSIWMSMEHCLRWHCTLGLFLKIYNRNVSCNLIVEFARYLLSDRDTTSSTGMGSGGNGNNQWEWEGNMNKTRLNLGSGMGINHWKWEEMGLKKNIPSHLYITLIA